jgi:hypothetical protein
MGWAGYVARVCVCVGGIGVYRDWWGNLRQRGHLEDLDFHRRIILEILKELNVTGVYWVDLVQHRESGWLS